MLMKVYYGIGPWIFLYFGMKVTNRAQRDFIPLIQFRLRTMSYDLPQTTKHFLAFITSKANPFSTSLFMIHPSPLIL